jgi:hypothetical protein
LKALLNLVRVTLAFVGFFVACEMLLVLGIAVAVWLGNPKSTSLPRGAGPAWDIVTSAWGLWLLGAGLILGWWVSNRYWRLLDAQAKSRNRG